MRDFRETETTPVQSAKFPAGQISTEAWDLIQQSGLEKYRNKDEGTDPGGTEPTPESLCKEELPIVGLFTGADANQECQERAPTQLDFDGLGTNRSIAQVPQLATGREREYAQFVDFANLSSDTDETWADVQKINLLSALEIGDREGEFAALKELVGLRERGNAEEILQAYVEPDGQVDLDRQARVQLVKGLEVKDTDFGMPEIEADMLPNLLKAAGEYLEIKGRSGRDDADLMLAGAKIAELLPRKDVDAKFIAMVSQQFSRSQISPDAFDSKTVREAMLRMAPHWDREDTRAYMSNLKPGMSTEITGIIDKVSSEVKAQMLSTLVDVARSDVRGSGLAINILKALREKNGREAVLTLRKLGHDLPESFEDPMRRPTDKDYEAIWTREFSRYPGYPTKQNDGDESSLAHRDLWYTMSRKFFDGTDPTGLDRLKKLVYENAANGGNEVSLKEVYSETRFVDSLSTYERSRQGGDKQSQQSALVDLLTLRKTSICSNLVANQIDKYLDNERKNGNLNDNDFTLASQEIQKRDLEAERVLSQSLAQGLNPKGSAEDIRKLQEQIVLSAIEAGHDPNNIADMNRFLRIKEAQETLKLFQAKDSENDPKLRPALDRALEIFGVGGHLAKDVNDTLGDTPAEVLAGLKHLVDSPDSRQLLIEFKYFDKLPFTALDAMHLGLFGSKSDNGGRRRGASALAALTALSTDSDALSKKSTVTTSDTKKLAETIEDLKSFGDSRPQRQLEKVLGGSGKLTKLIEDLGQDSTRPDALVTLNTALKTNEVKDALKQLQAFRDNPNVVVAARTLARKEEFGLDMTNLEQDVTNKSVHSGSFLTRPEVSGAEVAEAVEALKKRATSLNGEYDRMEADFLQRPEENENVEKIQARREEALKHLERFGLDSFVQGADDRRLSGPPELRSAHTLLKVSEATDPTEKAKAIREMMQLAEGGNASALDFVDRLKEGDGKNNLDVILHHLEKGTASQQADAIKALDKLLPNGEELMDQFRSRAIVRDVVNAVEPKVADFDAIKTKLEAEIALGNKCARDWMTWSTANHNIARLSLLGGGTGTSADRKAAVEDLVKQMNVDNNPYARDALFNMLTANTGVAGGQNTEGRFAKTPDLSHLSPAEQKELFGNVLDGIKNRLKKEGQLEHLTHSEVRALSLMLAQTGHLDHDLKGKVSGLLESHLANGGGHDTLDGLFWALKENGLPEKGRRAIGDLMVRYSNQPGFDSTAKDIVKMAGGKDPAAMYIMAGLLGKQGNRPAVEQVVKEAAELFQKSPEHASMLVQALVQRTNDSGDQHKLLETLGKVAGSPDAKINDALMKVARDELRAGFDLCFKKDGSPDRSFSATLNSAALGMAHMAKNWEAQDVDRLTRRMTPEVAVAMKIAAKDVPPTLRDSLIDKVLDRVRDTTQADGEWVPAFNALSSFAPFVKLSQFREMKLFSELASSSDAQVQLALGKAVLAFVNNGNPEVRQEAAEHFVTTGWAQEMGSEVRTELLNYAQDKDVKPEMLGKISELAYESGIKPPTVHLLRTLGFADVDKEQLEKAISAVGGEDKFREMLSRIASYDSLPKVVQTLLTEGKTDIGNLLPPDFVPFGANRGEKIDLKKMIEDLSKGSLPNRYKFLTTGDFEKNLKAIAEAAMKTVADRAGVSPERLQYELTRQRLAGLTGEGVEINDNVASDKKDARKESLNKLCEETKKGHDTSLGWLLLGGAGYFIARARNVSNFEERQAQLLGEFKGADVEFQKAVGEMRRLQAVLEATDLSRATQDHFRFAAEGDRIALDKKLLEMGNEYGLNTLQVLAPHAYSQLTGYGLESWQQGVFNRLYLNGLTAIPQLPQLQAHFGKPEAVKEALKVLSSRHLQKTLDSNDPKTWNSDYLAIQRESRAMMVHEALRAIDSNPAVTNVTNASAELMRIWPDLEKLVQAGIEGHRGKELVDHVRGLVSREENGKEVGLEPSIKKIQENIPEVKKVVQELKSELTNCSDPLAIKGLERRIQALEKMVETFSPNSKQMQQFNEMARLVMSGSYDESTFWKMIRDKAVPIIGTIAIAASVVVTLGTATPLAVIGGAVLTSAGSLTFMEGYAELSYQMNWTGTGGSQLGDAIRRRQHELGQRDSGFLVYDSKSGKFAPGPTFEQVAQNYGIQLVADTAMNLTLMGFGHLVGKGLRAVTGVDEITVNAQVLNKLLGTAKSSTAAFDEVVAPQTVKSLWKGWLAECGNQTGFAIASHGTEDALKHGFTEQNFFTHMAAALMVCAGHQTMAHGMKYGGKGLLPKWLKPNSMEVIAEKGQFMNVMTEQLAKLNAEGQAADANFRPVTMSETSGGKVEVTLPATETGGKSRVIEIAFVKPETALAQMKAEERERAEGSRGDASPDQSMMITMASPPKILDSTDVPREGQTVKVGKEGDLSLGLEAFPHVSRRHVEITAINGELVVRDLKSLNGTFVRTQDGTVTRIKGDHVLKPGEEIHLARGGPRVVNRNGRIELREPASDLTPAPTPAPAQPILGSIKLPRSGQDLTIGRSDGLAKELSPYDNSVSRSHACIFQNERGELVVRDLGSKHGTFISQPDGTVVMVTGNHTLGTGEHILLGRDGPRLVRNGSKFDLHEPAARQGGSDIDFARFADGSLILPKDYKPTGEAIAQTNKYHQTHEHTDLFEPGFHNAGKNIKLNTDGEFVKTGGRSPHVERPATVFDPANDPVLRAVMAEASSRYGHLRNDQKALMKALSEYTNQLLTAKVPNRQLNDWNDKFNADHAGERVLLGEFIRQGAGVCSQQSFLLKALAQHMGPNATMVRGMGGGHAWVEINIGGTPYIYDPRAMLLGVRITPQIREWYKPGVAK